MSDKELNEAVGSDEDWEDMESEHMEENEVPSGNMSWATAMSNVLSTASNREHFILSKAKKDTEIEQKKEKDVGVKIVDSSGKIVESKTKKKKDKTYAEMRQAQRENQRKKAEWEAMCRVKPDIIKKEKERELVRIATRGVVHLFNTVEQHQKNKAPGRNEKASIVKGAFMDILKQHSKQDQALRADPVVEKVKKEETWSILKDDFMMGAEMKDWDKASDEET